MSQFRRLVSEIHRRSLWQVLGVYAVASWIIYQIVLALYEGLGLPDWVPGTALVLLLIGLPIVLATAFVQEGAPGLHRVDGPDRRASLDGLETTTDALAAKRQGDDSATTTPLRAGIFTWSKAVTGGILAFAALGLATSGFMGMRALGIGPAATLVTSGALAERAEVVLADFSNATRDSLLGEVVTEALRIDLLQSPVIRLVDPARVGEALQRMRRTGEALTVELAREMALREGFAALIVGEVGALGTGFVLTARVLSTDDGAELLALRETAGGPDELLSAVDNLSARLREQVGESLRDIRSSPGLEQVSTSSIAALRSYSRGWQVLRQNGTAEAAADLFREAIRQDSTFAMAHRSLAVVLSNLGIERREEIAARTKAYEYRDRLSERERLLAEGAYQYGVTGDLDRARAVFEELVERFPDEADGHNYLGLIADRQGRPEERVEHHKRAVQLRYRDVYYNNLLFALLKAGQIDSARAVLPEYQRHAPPEMAPLIPAFLAIFVLDREMADSVLDAVEAEAGAGVERDDTRWHRIQLAAMEGRLDDLRRLAGSGWLWSIAHLERDVRGDTAAALRLFEELSRRNPMENTDLFDRPYLSVAVFLARSGRAKEAAVMLRAYEDSVPEDVRGLDITLLNHARAEVALARADLPTARTAIEAAAATSGCDRCTADQLARWYAAAGMADSALVQMERVANLTERRSVVYVGALGPTLYLLGAGYEDRGDLKKAAHYYARFADLWRDADPEFQPRVDAARRALARLTREDRD